MKYTLDKTENTSILSALKTMWPLLRDEKKSLIMALGAMLVNSSATFIGPFIMGRTIDKHVAIGDFSGVILWSCVLIGIYAVAFAANYWQMMFMGMVGQRTLYKLRNIIFQKLQDLPLAFFNANKSGDLISRINNDTSKLNQFFSEIVVRFVGIMVTIIGVAAFLIGINPKLGVIALVPALGIIAFTQLVSGWIKKKSSASLKVMGQLSGEAQESLENFKVVVAFDRRDFFRERFAVMNAANYIAARGAGFASMIPYPVYQLAGVIAQALVLVFGISMITQGQFTIGLLVGFLVYVNQFYNPLQQISQLWSGFQTALAAWDRVNSVLTLESDLKVAESPLLEGAPREAGGGVLGNNEDQNSTHPLTPSSRGGTEQEILSFNNVTFGYIENQKVLDNISLNLSAGKTYALVGPTGGGKTTTASLMARLYDPVNGEVKLFGRDLKTYTAEERSEAIGFILQDPFLFLGTVQDNIFYGNTRYPDLDADAAKKVLDEAGLLGLLGSFEGGLATEIAPGGTSLSLGQKQIIAFMRAVLRKPKLLILDEATANIDTITEQVLQKILDALPAETTRVIIAHRLNTIQNADEIFFVAGGKVTSAGSFDHAVEMLTG